MDAAHSPFTTDPASSVYFIDSNLGTIHDAGNPIFNGVNTALVNTDYQAQVNMNVGAQLVADWASGRHAIGIMDLGTYSVLALNLFPADFSTSDVDTQRLVANAANMSLQGGDDEEIPEPATLALLGLGLAGLGLSRAAASDQNACRSGTATSVAVWFCGLMFVVCCAISDYTSYCYLTLGSGMEVSVREFKSHLSSYLARVQDGEELVVTSHKHPIARVIGMPADVPAGIMRLLQTGQAEWHGGKPSGGRTRPVISGKTMAEMVLEDRG